jgi:hypothetical protein
MLADCIVVKVIVMLVVGDALGPAAPMRKCPSGWSNIDLSKIYYLFFPFEIVNSNYKNAQSSMKKYIPRENSSPLP